MGRTQAPAPWLEIIRRNDRDVHLLEGASSKDGRVWGCYLHGLFANQQFRQAWLASLGWMGDEAGFQTHEDKLSSAVSRLVDTVDAYLDMSRLDDIIWEN
jgi:adenosylcobyric acid synthase